MRFFMVAVSFALFIGHANALGVSDLTNTEANNGLKAALTQAAGKAVSQLSATDGFLGNNEVKIPLPDSLKKAERTMRMLGMGKQTDELVLRMNRAAEAAVPEAKALLVDSVKKMSVADAKAILTGGDDAATQYFKKHTSAPMTEKFLPIVKKATEDVQLAQQYNKFAEMGNKVGLVKKEQVNLEQYVTQKTLDGVYLMMAKEEAAIRKDPVGQTSSLLKKVFGALNY
ncbi:MAG: DUF4197 domain-containing protein [Methylotenera sp.]|nr:DUF4197 domain-containing protein [Methylotenera sp.]MDO9233162.1 DUF4197 domain-containing protein [Methylotenera sp.]MDO9388275.1 DUF4197 domain-containing protein [Methylotenera sp.]MDP2404119.1 DUF4197 domain-containing protein [Methylotenera sp.]MDP3094319.1 DUF4197 domain-containing protein [Methylotenera sp.]